MSSYVAISPVGDKYMKIRFTNSNPMTKASAARDCNDIQKLMKHLINSVGKPEGAEPDRSILDLLDEVRSEQI